MSPSCDPCHSEAPGEKDRRGKNCLEGGLPNVRGTERQGSGLSLEERKVKFSPAPRPETALRGPREKIAICFSTEAPDSASRGPGREPRPASAPLLDSSQQVPADFISAAGSGQLPRLIKGEPCTLMGEQRVVRGV